MPQFPDARSSHAGRKHKVHLCRTPARLPSLSQQLPQGSPGSQAGSPRELVGLHHLPCLFIHLQHLPRCRVHMARWWWQRAAKVAR